MGVSARWRTYVPDRGPARTLAIVALVDSVGTGFFMAGAAIFFVRSIGLTIAQVGLGLSLASAAGFLTAVPIGVLGDRFGARRVLAVLQVWRAACFGALLLVSGFGSFVVVAGLLAIADAAAPALTQAVAATTVGDRSRVRTMAILRSTRNVGFSLGALVAAPFLAADTVGASRAVVLADALSFLVAAVLLSRMRNDRAPDRSGVPRFLSTLMSFRDGRYGWLATLSSVLTLHMTILSIGIPLWLLRATRAPAGLIAGLMLLNTVMTVVLQVPLSQGVTGPQGGVSRLRRAGLMLAGCCAALAMAAHAASWAAVLLLLVATALLTLAEMWQAAGAWELSYRYADPRRRVQYLAVFSLGVSAQDVVGPGLLTVAVIGAGAAGWLGLATVFLVTILLVGPATAALDRSTIRQFPATPQVASSSK